MDRLNFSLFGWKQFRSDWRLEPLMSYPFFAQLFDSGFEPKPKNSFKPTIRYKNEKSILEFQRFLRWIIVHDFSIATDR